MTIGNRKFSNFEDGGEATVGDIVVGLRDGVNTRFDFPAVFGPGDIVPIENGGTAADNISDARTNLGLGTMAVQNANAVAITGGTIIADDIKVGGIELDNLGGISGVENLVLEGATSGTITLLPEAIAGTNTITFPAATGTVALTSGIPSFPLQPDLGGTGVDNGTATIQIDSDIKFSGAFTFDGTLTGNTTVTFPTSGTLATTSQLPTLPLSLSDGGTNKSLTASNGGIFYSDADSGEILAGTATARQMLQSGSSAAPAWSTATWPATTTANQILYSSAANTVGEITTAADSVMTTNGSGVPSLTSTLPTAVLNNIGGRLKSIQVFTSGTAATYNTPSGVTQILVTCVGGGGGGGGVASALSTLSCAGGGAGGGTSIKVFSPAAASYTYTVGQGGAGGAAGNNNGTAGGTTTFSTMSAGGGGGGGGSATSAVTAVQGAGGTPGSVTGGDINITGEYGGTGNGTGALVHSGYGGASQYAASTPGTNSAVSGSVVGAVGSQFGGGGTGAVQLNDTTNRAGGTGGVGIIIVYEYS